MYLHPEKDTADKFHNCNFAPIPLWQGIAQFTDSLRELTQPLTMGFHGSRNWLFQSLGQNMAWQILKMIPNVEIQLLLIAKIQSHIFSLYSSLLFSFFPMPCSSSFLFKGILLLADHCFQTI